MNLSKNQISKIASLIEDIENLKFDESGNEVCYFFLECKIITVSNSNQVSILLIFYNQGIELSMVINDQGNAFILPITGEKT